MSESVPTNEGAAMLRRWLAEHGAQSELAARVVQFGAEYGVPYLDGFSAMNVSHFVCHRRRPTSSQAVALHHICDIEPADWYRAPLADDSEVASAVEQVEF